MARGDEIDYRADDRFTWLDCWWVHVGRVKSVKESCVTITLSDTRLKAFSHIANIHFKTSSDVLLKILN